MNPFFSRLAGRFGGGGFGGPGGPGGGAAGSGGANNQNQRIKKRNRVIAVADQRTTSIIVSASRDLMDQIEAVVKQLDESKQGKQGVYVFELHHATPAEVLPPLQDSFGGNNQNNRTTSTTQNDPLQSRSTTQNQQNNATSRTSSSSRGVGGGGAGGGGSTFP